MSVGAQSYPQCRKREVPPNVTNRHASSTGVERDVESDKPLQITYISSPVSTRCRRAGTLLCSPLPEPERSGTEAWIAILSCLRRAFGMRWSVGSKGLYTSH